MGHFKNSADFWTPSRWMWGQATYEHLQHAHQVSVTQETTILRNTDTQEAPHTHLFPPTSSQYYPLSRSLGISEEKMDN